MAMNCAPCTGYYLKKANAADISGNEVSEILAKVMAVAAGKKRLQMQEVLECYDLAIGSFNQSP